MKRCAFLSIALASANMSGAVRPQYGGTVQIEMRAAVPDFDPSAWPASSIEAFAKEQIVTLLFDRLVELDASAQPRPALAASWQHDAEKRTWEFRPRSGVTFSDGSLLSSSDIAGVFRFEPSARTITSVDLVMVEFDRPMPRLLEELARARHSVFRRKPGGEILGTGPFRVTGWQPGRHLELSANDGHWAGRPFLDGVSIGLGRSLPEPGIDVEIGGGRPRRTWTSAPVDLIALVMDHVEAPHLREALALAINRPAVYNVLLRKQGEIAGGILPQWLSGYAFLFRAASDPARARQLAASAPGAKLSLGFDSGDPLIRSIAERISVDAREAGLTVQTTSRESADIRLVRTRMRSMIAAQALAEAAAELGFSDTPDVSGPQALYTVERSLLEGFRVVPLFHLPLVQAIGPPVRNWLPASSGAWRLADVWISPQ